MKLNVKKFQVGGELPAEEMPQESMPQEAPAQEQQAAEMVEQIVMQIAQQLQDPNLIMAVGQGLMEIAQQQAAPAEPQFRRKGGKIYFA